MKKHFLLSDIDRKFLSTEKSKNEYFIDLNGFVTIVNKKTGRIKITQGSENNGYYAIWVKDGQGKRTAIYVHKIVAKVLCTKPNGYDNTFKVVHMDKNKLNNQLSNICIVTDEEWKDHYMDEFSKMKGRSRLNNLPHSKLTEDQVRSIKLLFKNGHSTKAISELYDEVSLGQIYRIKRGENWSHI